jgi:hypothetical protein
MVVENIPKTLNRAEKLCARTERKDGNFKRRVVRFPEISIATSLKSLLKRVNSS